MKGQNVPETPQDLQHPGRLAMDADAADAADAAAPRLQAGAGSEQDDAPIFDDPIIGWWENAWSLREDEPTPL